jgi:hypothetical protein
MHLWNVSNTESGDQPSEYRCAHCGAVTRDDGRHPLPPCTEERERGACDVEVSGEVKAFSGICKGLEEQLKQTMRERDQLRAELKHVRELPDVEARYDERGTLDEVVTGPVEMFHLEYMDKDRVWMALYWGKDRRVVINLSVHGRSIVATVESDAEIVVPIRHTRA